MMPPLRWGSERDLRITCAYRIKQELYVRIRARLLIQIKPPGMPLSYFAG